jgi:hypothetical protein
MPGEAALEQTENPLVPAPDAREGRPVDRGVRAVRPGGAWLMPNGALPT